MRRIVQRSADLRDLKENLFGLSEADDRPISARRKPAATQRSADFNQFLDFQMRRRAKVLSCL
jgi:hypothetical protein